MSNNFVMNNAKIRGNKTLYTIALILMLTFAVFAVLPIIKASIEIPTFALLNVAPNPVGIGQMVYVNAFLSKPTPTAGMAGSGDQYENITIQVIRPDGTKETLGPFRSDSTGGTWTSYTPAQKGTYTFQMFYPGQTLKGGGVVFGGGGFNWTGSILLSSKSAPVTLVVQTEPIGMIYQTPPLPTEYWSRPIYGTNYNWAQLGGSWFGLRAPAFATTGMYDAMGNVQLYTTAPNTGHIVWTKPTQFGGIAGSPIPNDQSSQYNSISIAINYFEPIILNGIIYYTNYVSPNSVNNGWTAVDLRTGETLWTRTAGESGKEVIRMGQILRFHTVQEFGSSAYLWSTETAGFFQVPTFYSIYDAMTGKFLANVTNIQNPSYLMDYSGEQQGTLIGYYTNGTHLIKWNSTKMITSGFNPFGTTVVTVRVSGTYNYTSGIEWAVPIATTIGNAAISPSMSVGAVTPEVILMRAYASPGMFQELGYGYQITAGYNAKTGRLLWGPINQTLPYLNDMALLAARDGVYVLHNKDTDEAYGYSLTNGQQLWGPVKLPGNAWSSISRAAEIAYGKVYIWDFGGYVNALDLQTGEIKWTFTPRSAGYDAPYGIYPLWHFGTHSICDGKLFLSEGSMYNPPIHPAQRLAINCTDGSLVWSILSYSGRSPAAHADTYMVEWNSLDCQIYTFGKGQTATTVSIQNDVITHGNSVLIKGMVTDESAGTKTVDKQARFPAGVPAIADESMSPWMEYVYMQQPKPTNATGVRVHLTAYDPNGNFQDIGTTTSTADGKYGITWTPPVPGTYYVTATFEGSNSYYSSEDSTYLAVGPAPATPAPAATPTPTPATPPTATPTATASPSPTLNPEAGPSTDMYIIAAAAVVVIVVVAVAALVLRKRK